MEKRKPIEFPMTNGIKEVIVSMVEHKGILYLATRHRMYYHKDGEMHPVLFINDINQN